MNRRALVASVACGLFAAACGTSPDGGRIAGELASDRIELTVESSEPITDIQVIEGEAVTKGRLLLRQDSTRAEARLAEAEAALGQALARLNELVRGPRSELIEAARANRDGARRELDFRRADYERVQRIHAQQLASAELLDRARAALDAAEANDELRRAQLQELLSGTTVEELAQAEQAVKQAEARRDLAAVDAARHEIRAPVDGIVDSRLFEVGERPAPGQAVLIMLSGAQPYARVYVPEDHRIRVRPGTEARVFVDGLDTPLDGRVRWVSSEAAFTPYFALTEHDRGRLSFVAKIDIESDRPRLPDGVPVAVELLLDAGSP